MKRESKINYLEAELDAEGERSGNIRMEENVVANGCKYGFLI